MEKLKWLFSLMNLIEWFWSNVKPGIILIHICIYILLFDNIDGSKMKE